MMMMMMSDYKSTVPTNSFCQNLKQFDAKVSKESKSLDNLMNSLRTYYKDVKTKRQLNLEVPAGFRQDNMIQRQLKSSLPRGDYLSSTISRLGESSSTESLNSSSNSDLPILPDSNSDISSKCLFQCSDVLISHQYLFHLG